MKLFIRDIVVFSSVIAIALIVGFVLPATPRASKSLLFSKINKDELLLKDLDNRIILIGGSNVSFGFKSELFKDSLNLNPVNTGIHASIGLIYMLENGVENIKEGDIIVVAPEYSQFYGNFAYGGNELLRTVLDVDYSHLSLRQWMNVMRLIPAYSFSKLKY